MRAAYPDGVFWVVLGERPDLVAVQADLARQLGIAPGFRDVDEGRAALAEALRDKRALLVLDDAWAAADGEALALAGPKGRVLVTTRHSLVLKRLGTHALPVDRLDAADACRFLAHLAGQTNPLPPEAGELVEALGGVVLALALVGATIRSGTSWAAALRGVRAGAALYSDDTFANQFKAMHLAWEALDEQDRQRYRELAVFGEDVTVPVLTIERLWRHTGGLDQHDTDRLLKRLGRRSLASVDAGVRFHDLQRAFLQLQTPDSRARPSPAVGSSPSVLGRRGAVVLPPRRRALPLGPRGRAPGGIW